MSPTTSLHLSSKIARMVIAQAVTGFPREVCGVIGGNDGIGHVLHQVENLAETPETRYIMNPAGLVQALERFEAQGLNLVSIYHSHPAGPAEPSALDIAESYYPDVVYLIISLADPNVPSLTAWSICDGKANSARLTVGLASE